MSATTGVRRVPGEPEWFGSCKEEFKDTEKPSDDQTPITQTEVYQSLFMDGCKFGLNYAYQNQLHPKQDNDKFKYTKTNDPKQVIIVGAGMAGLTAAYELAQVGHDVSIIEKDTRVGGRVKTYSSPHFFKGLWSDSGAMRVPGTGSPRWKGPKHFLTDWYTNLFKLKRVPFYNQDGKGFYCFYGRSKIRVEVWDKHPGKYCTQFWPGWDAKLTPRMKTEYNIKDINTYYDATIKPVADLIRKNPKSGHAWHEWMMRWSKISLEDFLRSDLRSVLQRVGGRSDEELKPLADLLPWPEIAITGYSVFNYTPDQEMEANLAHGVREDLGNYWKDPMHTIEGGLSSLPWAFMERNEHGWNKSVDLSKCIKFGLTVREIKYYTDRGDHHVKVTCYNETLQEKEQHTANFVIITTPLHIIREMEFDPPLSSEMQNAIAGVYYGPSTKIFLQCQKQFWENEGIKGGFSKTNMPIGQVHYPSDPNFEAGPDERGILMCYTWGNEALMFGSQTTQNAIALAVREVSKIHPQINDHFEVGAVQSWYTDPSSQGAYAVLKTGQYCNIFQLMIYPHRNIYFAGEAISWSTGWIQGAVESGLRAAYMFFIRNEQKKR